MDMFFTLREQLIVLIDNGHGSNTSGKCSPDKQICIIGEDCAEINGLNIKYIKCSGTRTSASDAAVATLQQKGYTVSVTPA